MEFLLEKSEEGREKGNCGAEVLPFPLPLIPSPD
jgi:hypothetical protein